MKIKTNILAATALLIGAVSLSSCVKDGESTETATLYLCTHVVDTDGKNPALLGRNAYRFNYNLSAGTVQVMTEALKIGDTEYRVTSDEMSYQSFSMHGQPGFVRIFKGNGTTGGGEAVTDIKGMDSSYFYYFATPIPGVIEVAEVQRSAYLSFDIAGKYNVCTFRQDCFFGGKTTTHYDTDEETGKSFDTTGALYRLIFAEDLKTATVVIYNIQFAEEMKQPLKAVVLKGLAVKPTALGYTVEGQNVVPDMAMGNGVKPMDAFTFDSFIMSTASSDMIKVNCSYTVAGKYRGEFTGSYMEGSDAAASGK